MTNKVYLAKEAVNDLKKLTNEESALILSWLKKNIENSYNPRAYGKTINKLNLNQWIYYVGIYHLLSYIENEKIIILKITSHKETY